MADTIDTRRQHETEEQEQLLEQDQEQEQAEDHVVDDGSSEAEDEPLLTRRQTLHSATRHAKHLLGILLGVASAIFGMYILYIIAHIPRMYLVLRNIEPELVDATLIDITDGTVRFAATLHFSGINQQEFVVPMANITVRHEEQDVGWVLAENILVSDMKPLSLSEVFHVTDQAAMTRLVASTLSTRRAAVDARVRIDTSGFGKYLPTVYARSSLDLALPEMSVNITVSDINGPMADTRQGGITARTVLHVQLPIDVAADIGTVELVARYSDVDVARVTAGPTTIGRGGYGIVPVAINIRPIAGDKHELALANMARLIGAGRDFDIQISGASPGTYDSLPLWLRSALHNSPQLVSTGMVPGSVRLPSLDAAIRDVIASKVYAYWSAQESFNPWVGISGQTVVELPNPTNANVSIEIESLVPSLELVDENQQAFATLGQPQKPFRVKQVSPMSFMLLCDFDRIGLNVIEGHEKQYTKAIQRAITNRQILGGVNGTIDIMLKTSLGRLRIDAMPFHAMVNHTFELPEEPEVDTFLRHRIPEVDVTRIEITETRTDLVRAQIDLAVTNPFNYGAYITDLALKVKYAELHIATVGFKELKVSRGANSITVFADFINHPDDPRQQMFFLDVTAARKPISLTVQGFPNCTTIAPLEASLREFTQTFSVDLPKLKNGGGLGKSKLSETLREVIFHMFGMTAEATIHSPVSGASIWLQSIEAIGYYKGDIPLGTLEHDFLAEGQVSGGSESVSHGFLLPFDLDVTTPRMLITANETSIGWNVIRKAIGGTLDVDVFTNIQIQVGNARFNVTAMGKNAPVKIRW